MLVASSEFIDRAHVPMALDPLRVPANLGAQACGQKWHSLNAP